MILLKTQGKEVLINVLSIITPLNKILNIYDPLENPKRKRVLLIVLISVLGHLRGLQVGSKYRYNWSMSGMKLQSNKYNPYIYLL